MNTLLFNILVSMCISLCILEILLWRRICMQADFREVSESRLYRNVSIYVMGVAATVAIVAFIADSSIKFRLTFLVMLIAPIIIIHIKNRILYEHLSNQISNDSMTKRCCFVEQISRMIYPMFILMGIMYLR